MKHFLQVPHALLLALLLCCAHRVHAADSADYPQVHQGRQLTFPRDHGAHPAFRTEWWYITGWIESIAEKQNATERGFQITFFRNRPGVQEDIDSKFAPTQLVFAHAALSDPAHGKLRHDQRAARQGFGLAYANEGDTSVAIDDWTLSRRDDHYRAEIVSDTFAMSLTFSPTQSLMMHGEQGYSRKGSQPQQASYYYSRPQLVVSGDVRIDGEIYKVTGRAWLDHEWSSEILPSDAQGWDWVSINRHDGGALMAFRMRGTNGEHLWAGGSVRDVHGRLRILSPNQIRFEPRRRWTSPRTGITYPVSMRIQAGDDQFELEPLMDDQELDSTASTGIIYWEGAVRARTNGKEIGRGYLEMTGYGERPQM